MSSCFELRQKGLVQAFGLEPEDIDDADASLLGFFSTLQKIEQRLIREGKLEPEYD